MDGFEVFGLSEDDQNGVVAAEGTKHFWPLFPIEGFGNGLSAASQSANDEQVAGAFGAGVEGRKQAGQRRRVVPGFRWECVMRGPAGVVDLDQPKLANVTRQRGLRHIE